MTRMMAAIGLACLFATVGCSSKSDYQDYSDAEKGKNEHHHAEHGSHGGHLIELGKHEYHAEICLDPKTRKISIYISGHDPQEAMAIGAESILLELEEGDEETALTLMAVSQDGDEEGKASLFEIAGEEVPEQFNDLEELSGHFHVDIAGKEYVGDVAHDHDEHEEGEEHHDE